MGRVIKLNTPVTDVRADLPPGHKAVPIKLPMVRSADVGDAMVRRPGKAVASNTLKTLEKQSSILVTALLNLRYILAADPDPRAMVALLAWASLDPGEIQISAKWLHYFASILESEGRGRGPGPSLKL